MNDAYGDPRNYDPNDPEWDPYDYDSTWGGQPSPPQAPARPWTDPDSAPPEWLYNGNQQPVNNPGPGNYWAWNGSMWEIRTGPRQATTTPPPTTTGGIVDTTGDGGDPIGGGYQAPARRPLSALNYPQFNGGTFEAPPAFSYQDWALPTQADAQKEPGFDYALNQGIKAYENSKAYLGTYKTGGTIKGLNDYARNMANQNYDKVVDRSAQQYDRNRGNAADAYATNYGISRDVFDRNYTSAKDTYAPQARAAELQFARDWDVYAYEGDDDYRRWKAQIDANSP